MMSHLKSETGRRQQLQETSRLLEDNGSFFSTTLTLYLCSAKMKKGHNLRNESVVHHVESPTKTIEFLRGEIKEMEFEGMELAQENAALKCMMSGNDARWKRDKQAMQDQIDSAKQGLAFDSGRAMQTELEDELKELKLVLKDKEKCIYKLSSRPRNDQIERVKRELSDKCNQVKAMELSFDKKMKHIIAEKDAVIANVTNVNVALGHQNLELVAKLRGIQREVHPIQNEWKIKANALEDSLKAEQAEKKACYEKIKKLEKFQWKYGPVLSYQPLRSPTHKVTFCESAVSPGSLDAEPNVEEEEEEEEEDVGTLTSASQRFGEEDEPQPG
ncbi:uncharacterized protein LOC118125135 [Hippoglossus stenolepis]|uniref:uncharacterized protein LOC118125135 n=1 Tax=Hippoglossus stenolepis TaxID=195615 RepID=UPI001FAE7B6C|nr:uncharacterized protein LOC118125135 [Hippoglossus stenolepis]